MSLDPYSLCPCESGNKLKFCCADIATEMLKALQLHESGQSRAARKILEKLHQQQPARAWISTSFAGILLSMNEPVAARDALKELLEDNPSHPLGRILDATAALDIEGYDSAKAAIHRAFTKGVKHHPEMIGSLAAGVSSILLDEGRYMASRQHMALALRFVRPEDRERVIMQLLRFDSDKSIPYLLRGVHNLKPLDHLLDEEEQLTFKKSLGLSSLGCWSEAAAILTLLTKKHPESADLWNNIALFHAWDGDEEAAAEIFHKAGRLAEDRQQAITCETLGQLLDHEVNLVSHQVFYYKYESASRLLSILDNVSRLVRQQNVYPNQSGEDEEFIQYQILNREPLQEKLSTPIDFRGIPKFIGAFACIESPEYKGIGRLSVEQEFYEETKEFLEEAAGDLIEPANIKNEQGEDLLPGESYELGWLEYHQLDEIFHLDEKTYGLKLAELEHEKWNYFSNQLWQNTPFSALNGKTPLEAVGDAELAIPLAAAVNIFDIFADQFNHQLDTDAIREQLNIEKFEPYEIIDDAQLDSCEVLEMLRIPVESLSDEQLKQLLNRSQLIQHSRLSERVLGIALQKEGVIEDERMPQALHNYIDLAKFDFKIDVSLQRVQLAREWSERVGQEPTKALEWEMRELQFRMEDPETPGLVDFLNKLYQQYLRKMPELEAIITNLLAMNNVLPPWHSGKIVTPGGESASNELWNPEKEAEASSGGKLWLPGQD